MYVCVRERLRTVLTTLRGGALTLRLRPATKAAQAGQRTPPFSVSLKPPPEPVLRTPGEFQPHKDVRAPLSPGSGIARGAASDSRTPLPPSLPAGRAAQPVPRGGCNQDSGCRARRLPGFASALQQARRAALPPPSSATHPGGLHQVVATQRVVQVEADHFAVGQGEGAGHWGCVGSWWTDKRGASSALPGEEAVAWPCVVLLQLPAVSDPTH